MMPRSHLSNAGHIYDLSVWKCVRERERDRERERESRSH